MTNRKKTRRKCELRQKIQANRLKKGPDHKAIKIQANTLKKGPQSHKKDKLTD